MHIVLFSNWFLAEVSSFSVTRVSLLCIQEERMRDEKTRREHTRVQWESTLSQQQQHAHVSIKTCLDLYDKSAMNTFREKKTRDETWMFSGSKQKIHLETQRCVREIEKRIRWQEASVCFFVWRIKGFTMYESVQSRWLKKNGKEWNKTRTHWERRTM